MAKIAQAFTTYAAKGNREDFSNAIYNIDPFDTPVMSMCKRRNIKARTFDWQTERLPNVDPDNAQLEGFELVRTASQPTVRLTNTTQISKRDATVSGSQEESDAAGKTSEMGHQMALKSKVLKSDIETILTSRQPRVDGDEETPRRTEAIAHWIARATDRSNVAGSNVVGYKTGLPVAAGSAFAAVAAGDQIAFTEKLVGDALQQAYDNGADPSVLVVPPAIKRTVSTFKGRTDSRVSIGRNEVVSTIDIIQTDFGRLKVLPSRWIAKDMALMVDPNYVAMGFFRNFRNSLLAKVGDAETRMILAEWGVEMRNPNAHILFNGVKQGAVIGQ